MCYFKSQILFKLSLSLTDQKTHIIITSSLPTSPLLPSERQENTNSSNGGMPVQFKTSLSSSSFCLSMWEELTWSLSLTVQHTHQIMTPSLPPERPGNTRTSNGGTYVCINHPVFIHKKKRRPEILIKAQLKKKF